MGARAGSGLKSTIRRVRYVLREFVSSAVLAAHLGHLERKPFEGKDASMRINRSYVPVWKTAQHGRLARFPARPVKPGVAGCNDLREPRPLDWDQAVRAAKARLNEQCVLPDTMDHPLVADQAAWLAGLLCAYGKLADEVDHMEARADATP